MEIKVNLDVSTLSTEEKVALVQKIFESDKEIASKILESKGNEIDTVGVSADQLKKIVDKDFERYDNVFKALS